MEEGKVFDAVVRRVRGGRGLPSRATTIRFGCPASVGHHITDYTTLERLCCRKHNRSITVSPRRYRDTDGVWKDAASLRPIDLAVLILAMEEARRFIASTPLPGQPVEGEEFDEFSSHDQPDAAAE